MIVSYDTIKDRQKACQTAGSAIGAAWVEFSVVTTTQ
jgi:hypothetical protein